MEPSLEPQASVSSHFQAEKTQQEAFKQTTRAYDEGGKIHHQNDYLNSNNHRETLADG